MEVRWVEAIDQIENVPRHPLTHFQYESEEEKKNEGVEDVGVTVGLGYNHQGLMGHFRVKERSVRAVNVELNSPVYQDSCVEIFLSSTRDNKTEKKEGEDEEDYFNFEFNCIGALLAAKGPSRHQRVALGSSVVEAVKVWTSLPSNKPFEERIAEQLEEKEEAKKGTALFEWWLSFLIPWPVIEVNPGDILQRTKEEGEQQEGGKEAVLLKGNCYKCGDKLSKPHWVTLFPIVTARPDFHRPESFQPLLLVAK